MSTLYQRPDWVRRLNKFGPAVGDASLIVPLDPEEMLATAGRSLGLEDVAAERAFRMSLALAQGQLALYGFGFMLDQVRRQRDEGLLPGDQIVDMHYRDLIADPADAVRRIYDRMGRAWPDGHDEVVEGYLRAKPRGKFGRHEYDFETYGLDPDDVRKTYAEYVDYYRIVSEA